MSDGLAEVVNAHQYVASGLRGVRASLIDALHEQIDGDYLVGADPWSDGDLAIRDARVSDVIRWVADVLAPLPGPIGGCGDKGCDEEHGNEHDDMTTAATEGDTK